VLAQTIATQEKVPDSFPATAIELAQKLEAHPLARAPQKLLAVDLRIREQKDTRDTLIAEATERWKAGDPDEITALATWLNGKSEYQRELDAIPLEKALQSRDLFLQHLDALGGLGRWPEIKELLDRDTYPLDPVVQRAELRAVSVDREAGAVVGEDRREDVVVGEVPAAVIRIVGDEHVALAELLDAEELERDPPRFGAFIAEVDGLAVGYSVYFEIYSTFLVRAKLYMEDLFVHPDHRSTGAGFALVRALADEAVRRDCAGIEWECLDWNRLAIDFYERIGGHHEEQWLRYKLDEDGMRKLVSEDYSARRAQ